MLSGMKKPVGGGLSGEHIKLCAEGARREPNLSGKRTEERIIAFSVSFYEQSLWAAYFIITERGLLLCLKNPLTQLAL